MAEIDWELMTEVIREWAEMNDVSPTDFSEKLGYTYQYAWNVLRGKGEVRDETLGRLAIGFDIEALEIVLGEYRARVNARADSTFVTNL
jgi:transcriptional regulator with XRE-family HTH domain